MDSSVFITFSTQTPLKALNLITKCQVMLSAQFCPFIYKALLSSPGVITEYSERYCEFL
jgi:hypothetical protein